MIRRVIVGKDVRIGSFKNISMPLFILNLRQVKDGDCLLARRFVGASLLCSILVKSFRLIVNKGGLESNNTAVRLAHI